jgi:hypothetical protein
MQLPCKDERICDHGGCDRGNCMDAGRKDSARPAGAALIAQGIGPALLRAGLLAIVALGVARLHAAYQPGVLCPLRRLTGVPCPMCGSTSAFVELGHGRLLAAWAAQPFTMAVTFFLVAAPKAFSLAYRQILARPRLALSCAAGLAAASWLYQLVRFGLL